MITANKRLKKIVQNSILLLGSVLLVLIPIELYLRNQIPIQPPMTEPNEQTLYQLIPSLKVRASSPGDFEVVYHTNSMGFRGLHETALDKPPNTIRILGLGDSFTFGIGVEDDETFLAILEKKIREEKKSIPVEVINGAVFGWGTAHELNFFETKGVSLRPDLVIVGFFENDVTDNLYSGLFTVQKGKLKKTPPEILIPLAAKKSWARFIPLYKFLATHSAFLSWLRIQYTHFQGRKYEKAILATLHQHEKNPIELGLLLTTLLFQRIEARASDTGAKVVFMLIPSRDTLEQLEKGNRLPFYDKLSEICSQKNLDCIDFATELLSSKISYRSLYFQRDLHWTPLGHRLVGEILFKKLTERKLLDFQ